MYDNNVSLLLMVVVIKVCYVTSSHFTLLCNVIYSTSDSIIN